MSLFKFLVYIHKILSKDQYSCKDQPNLLLLCMWLSVIISLESFTPFSITSSIKNIQSSDSYDFEYKTVCVLIYLCIFGCLIDVVDKINVHTC